MISEGLRVFSWLRVRKGRVVVVVTGLLVAVATAGLAFWAAAAAKLLGLPDLPIIDQLKLVVGWWAGGLLRVAIGGAEGGQSGKSLIEPVG